MSKAEDRARDLGYGTDLLNRAEYTANDELDAFIDGYHQAEKDIKDELSELFREFMMDCVNDSTDTHILHFVEVFNNKIKEIGNE